MNPAELRMMWMSQYNPERMTLEDAATYFAHPSVLSVMDDLSHHQTMDLNPMMSIVGGDFSGQAAAAAALGVQPTALLTANSNANAIYGLAQVGGLHQHLLQQSAAAAVFQNYTEIVDDDDNAVAGVVTSSGGIGIGGSGSGMLCVDGDGSGGGGVGIAIDNDRSEALVATHLLPTANDNLQQQQVFEHMDDTATYDEGIAELTPKQEYINIDDFVMMTDSNSYDDTEYMTNNADAKDNVTHDNELLMPITGDQKFLNNNDNDDDDENNDNGGGNGSDGVGVRGVKNLHHNATAVAEDTVVAASSCTVGGGGSSNSGHHHRSQRKTRKIEPVNRPGLVLKTPIAYKGNIDPSVIPIQKDGMAVCERCGAIGVKHTFYTKSRRFCSMSCARGELYSLVVNNKINNAGSDGGSVGNSNDPIQQHNSNLTSDGSNENTQSTNNINLQQQQQHQQDHQSDIELELRVGHLRNSNYRFRITDQSKITQINGFGEPITTPTAATTNDGNNLQSINLVNESIDQQNKIISSATLDATNSMGIDCIGGVDVNLLAGGSSSGDGQQDSNSIGKSLRMYHDVLPQDELPQIPKLERLPGGGGTCPQLEKIISIRRRLYDPMHSYDWTQRLGQPQFVAAPVTCFPHAPGYEVWDNIGIEMKVEVENTDCDSLEVIQPGQTPHSFWVATILNICGYKALMRYEGFNDSTHDFWVNLCNAEVHSVGWCATRGKPLIPPRSIENKYKDWKDFLVERLSGARTLPSSFYNKINDSMQSRFRLGLNLECVDKDRISQVRLATVTKIVGKRLFLRYFDSDDGFWCHEDSPIIHPVGWATTVGHNLAAPQNYLERMLAGREAMIEVHEDDATIELFKMNFTFEEYYLDGKTNGFMEGMKLEAVDPLNLSSICAATVMAVLKFGYMMIRIDSYQPDASGSDWFCYHEKSPSIFPVGFCVSNNILLTPPNGYDMNTFHWDTYLQDTESIAAGQHLFHRVVPNHGFEVGMSLECADLMDPRLVCVATVARVVGRLLKIHFDGWTDEYDQWLDCESPDVYPVGWCVLVNHKLEGPPAVVQPTSRTAPKPRTQKKRKKKITTTTANAKLNCNESTVKSRTIALKTNPHLPKLSIKLELKPEHHNAAFYEDSSGIADIVGGGDSNAGIDDGADEDEYEDDCNSHRSNQSTPVTATTEPLNTNQTNASATCNTPTAATTTMIGGAAATTANQIRTNNLTVKKASSPAPPPSAGRRTSSYIANSLVSNSKYIPRLNDTTNEHSTAAQTSTETDLMPETWNVYDVSQFLRVNDCTAHCDNFSRNKIDGKRLLQLTKDEIIILLGMKVGPALKINDLIQQLKCRINPGKSRLHQKNTNKAFL